VHASIKGNLFIIFILMGKFSDHVHYEIINVKEIHAATTNESREEKFKVNTQITTVERG
jgi:hypothetical protein